MRDAIASLTFSCAKSDTILLLSKNLDFPVYLSFDCSSTASEAILADGGAAEKGANF